VADFLLFVRDSLDAATFSDLDLLGAGIDADESMTVSGAGRFLVVESMGVVFGSSWETRFDFFRFLSLFHGKS